MSVAEIIDNLMSAMNSSGELIVGLMPSKNVCNEEIFNEFWQLHTALIVYHYDAVMLMRYSLLSALTGYYSVAFSELRNALESVIRGIIFDLLAIPQYRKNAVNLKKINGFKAAKSFKELLELIEKEIGDSRIVPSAYLFDLMESKLTDFNPSAAFAKLLEQLKNWGIIDGHLFKIIHDYYSELSGHAHRVHPRFLETGARIATYRDWIELEPVPEYLLKYLNKFIDVSGIITYLVLRVFSIDLANDQYLRCVDWKEVANIDNELARLSREYLCWQKVKELVESLKQHPNNIAEN
ncbi:hypothetical protein [Pyrodictium abyssi]|uniref:hypothetical protein n=1 Tax=Pyrodictium abyssi TaxID=54256 RepID=UPI0030C6E03A